MEKKYKRFFEEIKAFQEKQKMQKQRGLNDYNMVNVVRNENAEVGMHSNVIYSLIDPNGLHYQDDLFLNLFIEHVIEPKIRESENYDGFGKIISVDAEEQTTNNRRIDFTIKSSKYYIGIEMKIDANDLDEQLADYEKDLLEKAQKDAKQDVIIFYLTKDGKEANENSHKGIIYKQVSFKNHILNWIDSCQHEVRNITNLNEAFENYKEIVHKITDSTYKGKIMQLEDELLDKSYDGNYELSNEKYKLAKYISNAYHKAEKQLRKSFVEQVRHQLEPLELQTIEEEHSNGKDPWHCLNIKEKFFIRLFRNESGVTLQVTDLNNPFSKVDISMKKKFLTSFQKINKNFHGGWSESYAVLNLNDDEVNNFDFKQLISEILKIDANL